MGAVFLRQPGTSFARRRKPANQNGLAPLAGGLLAQRFRGFQPDKLEVVELRLQAVDFALDLA